MRLRQYAGLLAAGGLALAGCDRHDDGQPGVATADEDQRLNDAAAMLDNQSVSPTALANDNEEQAQ